MSTFRNFLLVEWNVLSLYNYQGRPVGIPKWKGMSVEPLYAPCVSLCNDTLAVRDQSSYKRTFIKKIKVGLVSTMNFLALASFSFCYFKLLLNE